MSRESGRSETATKFEGNMVNAHCEKILDSPNNVGFQRLVEGKSRGSRSLENHFFRSKPEDTKNSGAVRTRKSSKTFTSSSKSFSVSRQSRSPEHDHPL